MANNNSLKVSSNKNSDDENKFVFGKLNYILMVVGFVFLFIGYVLLCGGGSDDPDVFNYAMFDARRLYVAPILIFLGFVVEIVAIMYHPKNGDKQEQKED